MIDERREVAEALVERVNECYYELKTGFVPDAPLYNGRLDGLFIAVNTALVGTNLKLIFDEKSSYYDLIEEA